MSGVYEEVIRIVAASGDTPQREEIMWELSAEIEQNDREYRALLRAAETLVDNPATDSTALGRIKRLSNIFSPEELDEKVGLLMDVIFSREGIPA